MLAAVLAMPAPASAQPRTSHHAETVAYAAGWAARQVSAVGFLPPGGPPDLALTTGAVLALTAAEVGADARDRALGWLAAEVETLVVDDSGDDRADALGRVVLAAAAGGANPRAFGPQASDLVGRILATAQTNGPDAGLYGSASAFAAVPGHAHALLGVLAGGATPDPTSVTWLVEQQCPDGGWPTYRDLASRETDTCEIATPDVASTALALQALAAAATPPRVDPLPFLAALRMPDGGFGFRVGVAADASSTAEGVLALLAAGGDPAAEPWTDAEGTGPLRYLTDLQIGCEGPGGDRGALLADPEATVVDPGATLTATRALAGALLPVGFTEGTTGDPFAPCPLEVERIAGDGRTATAAALALRAYPDGAGAVVVASGAGYADALAGAPLAATLDAPILLAERDTVPAVALDAVVQLGATRAVLLGGLAVLGPEVEDDLRGAGVAEIERIAGDNRFATAAAIAAAVGGDHVYVAEGADPDPARGWPDALAVGALAALQRWPVLLVTTEELPAETAAALDGVVEAVVVGGPAAVSEEVAAAVAERVETSTRVAGATRYETAALLADRARAFGAGVGGIWLATGRGFADALAAGPAVARAGEVLLLVDGADIAGSPPTQDYVRSVDYALDALHVVGGTAAITEAVVAALADAAREGAGIS